MEATYEMIPLKADAYWLFNGETFIYIYIIWKHDECNRNHCFKNAKDATDLMLVD